MGQAHMGRVCAIIYWLRVGQNIQVFINKMGRPRSLEYGPTNIVNIYVYLLMGFESVLWFPRFNPCSRGLQLSTYNYVKAHRCRHLNMSTRVTQADRIVTLLSKSKLTVTISPPVTCYNFLPVDILSMRVKYSECC